ncbi:MAG: hypothetical protein GKR89_18320 [Candidatus Latescibacteria bacterium]|nr:hypothetical protein [Candidatus Latescibacterota bacterium]
MKRIAAYVGLLGVLGWGAAGASNLPTDLDLVVETLEGVVDEGLAAMQMPIDSVGVQQQGRVLLVAEGKHDANWLVEHILAERMLGRGFGVGLDTTRAEAGGIRLSYRVLDLGLSGRSGLLGSKVQRQSRAALALNLSRVGEETLFWAAEFTSQLSDRIPKDQVELLKSDEYKFAKADIEEQSWSKFAEPVIVTTVLGGLIYLFFSNR